MTTVSAPLLARLDAIGAAVAATGAAHALLGLGSVGTERDRLDQYSDLDFFVIVQPGQKANFLHNLDWLERAAPIAYTFQNTVDGYKTLFADGIFCEFAIFEPAELAQIPFAVGQTVWKADGFDEALLIPTHTSTARRSHTPEYLIGEALSCLYVGLNRFHRGERLSAQRFIQQLAVDCVLELASMIEPAQPVAADPFAIERRFEQRFPLTAAQLPSFMQGYHASPESAAALLAFLDHHVGVNPAMKQRIEALCAEPSSGH